MLHAFEDMARMNPRQLCFTVVDTAGREYPFSYHQARLYGSALSQCLLAAGVHRGDYVIVALPNCAAWPLLLLAAAYGNFALIGMDPYLSDMERTSRRTELEVAPNTHISYVVDNANIDALMESARALIDGDLVASSDQRGFSIRSAAAGHTAPRTSLSSGPTRSGYLGDRRDHTKLPPAQLRRYATDAEESVVHFADHQSHLFDGSKRAIVIFTAGRTGKSKPVPLSWENITQAANSFNRVYHTRGRGVWQAVVPFYQADGLQLIVRSFCNRSSLVIYDHFDARTILAGVNRLGATHLLLNEVMLRDLLAADISGTLKRYAYLMLMDTQVKADLMARAAATGISLFTSYGMTETAGQIATSQPADKTAGGLRLLPGYAARIVDVGPDGYGKLAVKGPGVCAGYFSTRLATTTDGYFITGDTASLQNDILFVRARTADVFVSEGENVFPEEVRKVILSCEKVSEALVFGARMPGGGKRPVAFVERADQGDYHRATTHQFSEQLLADIEPRLSRGSRPALIFAMDAFPRNASGRINVKLLEKCFDERIEINTITLHVLEVPFSRAATGDVPMTHQDTLLVEVSDRAGHVGLGEYSPNMEASVQPQPLSESIEYLSRVIIPVLKDAAFLHPAQFYEYLVPCGGIRSHSGALAAVEMAVWDLYGQTTRMPLWRLMGGSAATDDEKPLRLRVGAVVGLGSVQETVEAVWRCAEAGYGRVQIEVEPQSAFDIVRAVRQVFPDLDITLDARQRFSASNVRTLAQLDEFNITWIREPLSFDWSVRGAAERLNKLSALQQELRTPLCIGSSYLNVAEAYTALEFPNLKYIAVRVDKLGGIQATLDFIRAAQAKGVRVLMDGSGGLGVYRRASAAIQTLPGIEDKGLIGSVLRDFPNDVTNPPYTVERGLVTLCKASGSYGIGCSLDSLSLAKFVTKSFAV